MSEDSFYRCYKALHYITHEAIPCVEESLKTWHSNQQQTLSPCIVQCPGGKKPKLPASCFNCVDWANAIESAYYQAGASTQKTQKPITWQNVHSSDFHKSYVEVAKAFVLRLPKATCKTATPTTQLQAGTGAASTSPLSSSSSSSAAPSATATAVVTYQSTAASPSATTLLQPTSSSGSSAVPAPVTATASVSSSSSSAATTATAGLVLAGSTGTPSPSCSAPSSTHPPSQRYTKISDFDAASLLMIMTRFSEFHKGDQKAYELIEKVRVHFEIVILH